MQVVETNTTPRSAFRVKLTVRFLVLSLAAFSVFAFGVGRLCRQHLMYELQQAHRNVGNRWYHQLTPVDDSEGQPEDKTARNLLPHPVLAPGKALPSTTYTSKQFDTSLPVTSDSVLLSRFPSDLPQPILAPGKPVPSTTYTSKQFDTSLSVSSDSVLLSRSPSASPYNYTTTIDGFPTPSPSLPEPYGQHFIIDIGNVDEGFLNSVERLAWAMVKLVEETDLTMLSYTCHALDPMGVSCVGTLYESGHVSFHTWPVEGVITLDLMACGCDQQLRHLAGTFQKLFGIPKESGDDVRPPRAIWMLKNRGFSQRSSSSSPLTATHPDALERSHFLTGWMEFDMKEEVAYEDTGLQTIEVFDVIQPRFRSLESYRKSLSGNDKESYEALHPELFRPDRMVYVNNELQSRRYGEAAYHESLVHPAMLAHPHPRRVAIIGGGEGATLREVLKHKAVERVSMIEIDEEVIQASKRYLQDWNDCSDLASTSTANSCFDDPRAEISYEDASVWFIENFGGNRSCEDPRRYDVIIMDAL